MRRTYEIYGQTIPGTVGDIKMPGVEITDTYITEKVLNIPWCSDGKTYS